ncbi:hypothetical protein AB0H88_35090 [Nonomuraea sp. NPDC050680]|uniref:hypothetical protein n=1 Tax=Nonomuraea sp. NPDC050680 TaxID=3154630 RepID=UPI0033DCD0B1
MAIKIRGARTLTLATVGALAASLLAVGGVATASSASEVYACVHKKTRYARIVNATTPCRKTEIRMVIGGGGQSTTTITEGTKGDTGPQGPKGDTGLQGRQGLPGKDGKDGLPGKDGKDGLPGKAGADGKDGADGKNGLPGKDGTDGKNGLPGKDGQDGKDGKGITYTTYTRSNTFSSGSGSASCDSGDVATGGGFSISGNGNVTSSAPSGASSWSVTAAKNDTNNNLTGGNHGGVSGTVYVICLKKS